MRYLQLYESHQRQEYGGKAFSGCPEDDAGVWSIHYRVRGIDLLWTGERTRPDGDDRDPVDDFITVDLALTAKNFRYPVEIQAVIRNLFDEQYVDPDTSGTFQYITDDFPREGRSAMLTLSYKF